MRCMNLKLWEAYYIVIFSCEVNECVIENEVSFVVYIYQTIFQVKETSNRPKKNTNSSTYVKYM